MWIIIVSQFTRVAQTSKGRYPEFTSAAPPKIAKLLINLFSQTLKKMHIQVYNGVFGSQMIVKSENSGPINFIIEKNAVNNLVQ